MKKTILLIACICIVALASAQNEKYLDGMQKALIVLQEADQAEEAEARNQKLQSAANRFERIGNVEKEEWLPVYYQAYCYMMLSVQSMQSNKEALSSYLDKAQEALDRTKAIAPKESEVLALQGYIYQGRIWPNPMVNGARFSPLSTQACQQAIALNPDNPRPYYLIGQNLFYTPEFFGGGPKAAQPMLTTAKEKFENFKKSSDFHPDWGTKYNGYLLKQTEKE